MFINDYEYFKRKSPLREAFINNGTLYSFDFQEYKIWFYVNTNMNIVLQTLTIFQFYNVINIPNQLIGCMCKLNYKLVIFTPHAIIPIQNL